MIISKTPSIVCNFPSNLEWKLSRKGKKMYLTFDDGPTPGVTERILVMLNNYQAKATFFCLGKNVLIYPELYDQIVMEGHTVGNHTYNHLNGWTTRNVKYFNDIDKASHVIKSKLFRPPYGKLRTSQIFRLKANYRIIMWEILSGDYSRSVSPEKCAENVISNAQAGSIIVFHDSIKAKNNMLFALPLVLEHFSKLGYTFEAISNLRLPKASMEQ